MLKQSEGSNKTPPSYIGAYSWLKVKGTFFNLPMHYDCKRYVSACKASLCEGYLLLRKLKRKILINCLRFDRRARNSYNPGTLSA